MAPTRIGIDLSQSPLRVGGLLLGKYIVAKGSKDIKVNGDHAPSSNEVVQSFKDARQVVKYFFGAPDFQAAVVVVPNSTSSENREAVASAGRSAGFNVVQVIDERTAVVAAYEEKVRPAPPRRIAIVSLTGGVLDLSVIAFKTDVFEKPEFILEAQETHPEPINFDHKGEHHERKHGPGGLLGDIGGLVGGAVKTLVVDPLDKAFDVLRSILSSPKFGEAEVDEVVFVGKASRSEKLQLAVTERFPMANVWEEIEPEEVAAYGAGVLAFKDKKLWVKDGGEFQTEEERLELPVPGESAGDGAGSIGEVHFGG